MACQPTIDRWDELAPNCLSDPNPALKREDASDLLIPPAVDFSSVSVVPKDAH